MKSKRSRKKVNWKAEVINRDKELEYLKLSRQEYMTRMSTAEAQNNVYKALTVHLTPMTIALEKMGLALAEVTKSLEETNRLEHKQRRDPC